MFKGNNANRIKNKYNSTVISSMALLASSSLKTNIFKTTKNNKRNNRKPQTEVRLKGATEAEKSFKSF